MKRTNFAKQIKHEDNRVLIFSDEKLADAWEEARKEIEEERSLEKGTERAT